MPVTSLGHLVLTVRNIEAIRSFYCAMLDMSLATFGAGRIALEFGVQKINLHEAGRELEPKSALATPGSADRCFLTDEPIADVETH